MSKSYRFAARDSSLPEGHAPIHYNRNPLLNEPEIVEGYRMKRTFRGLNGRTCYVYETQTGAEFLTYGPLLRAAI